MKNIGVWGTIIELYAASELFAFNFIVYNSNLLNVYCSHIHSDKFPTIYLHFVNRNHFDLLFKKNDLPTLSKEKEKKSFKGLLKETSSLTSKYTFKTKQNLKSLKKVGEKYAPIKIELKKEVKKAHRTIYPPGKNNSNQYNEIFQFYSQKKIPERFLPLALHQKRYNNWVKDIRKCYTLNKVSSNSYSLSRLQFKRENNEEVTIPFDDEIEKIIEENHNSFGLNVKKHFGVQITLGNIRLKGLSWANMANNVRKFISRCPDCVQNKHEPPLKETKSIVPKRPLERLQGDLIHLSTEQITACNKNYKYIFSVVDHFSKYKWCFAIKEKNGKSIEKCLRSVIATFGTPSIFQTDNGKEFKNSTLKSFLDSQKIEYINGSVRHPQSQGLVERHNRELKDYLQRAFNDFINQRENGEEWNLPLDLEIFRVRENNRFHTVTRATANTIIISKDEKLLHNVRNNIEKYYQKFQYDNKNQINGLLKKGTKVFIVQNVQANRNHTKLDKPKPQKLKKDKQKIKLPAIVFSDYQREDASVKIIVVVQNEIKLKLDNIYHIHPNFLSIPTETSWEIIFNNMHE